MNIPHAARGRPMDKFVIHGRLIAVFLAIVVISVSLPDFALAKPSKDELALAAKPAEIAEKMRLYDDPLAEFIIASTQFHRRTTGGLLSNFNVDPFVMTTVNRKTREVVYSAVFEIRYTGRWQFFSAATYDVGDGPTAARFTVLSRELVTCRRLECDYIEAVSVRLPDQLVADAAAGLIPSPTWPVRLTADNGPASTVQVPVNEIAAAKLAGDKLR